VRNPLEDLIAQIFYSVPVTRLPAALPTSLCFFYFFYNPSVFLKRLLRYTIVQLRASAHWIISIFFLDQEAQPAPEALTWQQPRVSAVISARRRLSQPSGDSGLLQIRIHP
jgi:hypothetical protein